MRRKRVFFKTFGCRTNQYDTQIMIGALRNFEHCDNEENSDIVVVNSCTVTNGADASVRNYIKSVKRKNPDARIVLAGCGAHSRGRDMLESDMVFGVMGHSERENIDKILDIDENFYEIGDLKHIDSSVIENFSGRRRAFVKIQEGCDFRCNYCIIPHVRGNARSQREEKIVEQVSILASNGFEEFILTGTNTGSYGKDRGTSLPKLLRKLSALKGVRRIRLGSLEPMQVDDELIELAREPWMAKHFHVALQHTSDHMLKVMNRRNDFAGDRELLRKLSDAGCAIGTDFIIGHPGESESVWREALSRVDTLPLTHIHLFSYSKRDGTRSALMGGETRGDVRKERRLELMSMIREKNYRFRLSHSKGLDVLIESGKNGVYSGFDQYYNKINISSSEEIAGKWIRISEAEVKDENNHAVFGV